MRRRIISSIPRSMTAIYLHIHLISSLRTPPLHYQPNQLCTSLVAFPPLCTPLPSSSIVANSIHPSNHPTNPKQHKQRRETHREQTKQSQSVVIIIAWLFIHSLQSSKQVALAIQPEQLTSQPRHSTFRKSPRSAKGTETSIKIHAVGKIHAKQSNSEDMVVCNARRT